jgi:hypothetical protein
MELGRAASAGVGRSTDTVGSPRLGAISVQPRDAACCRTESTSPDPSAQPSLVATDVRLLRSVTATNLEEPGLSYGPVTRKPPTAPEPWRLSVKACSSKVQRPASAPLGPDNPSDLRQRSSSTRVRPDGKEKVRGVPAAFPLKALGRGQAGVRVALPMPGHPDGSADGSAISSALRLPARLCSHMRTLTCVDVG